MFTSGEVLVKIIFQESIIVKSFKDEPVVDFLMT